MAAGPIKVVVLGAGNRGTGHSRYALDCPDRMQVVAVAEPRKISRERLQKMHNISATRTYTTWEQVAVEDKFADCVFITTQDQMHKEPAVAFAEKGYHIFLEKPMAVTYEDCCDIVAACKRNHVILAVGHVLRYTPVARKLKELIASGVIGDVVNIQHIEPVGWFHFAHSYVRGNWRNLESSTFFLLAKACHDIDLVQYWMGDAKCKSVSSFGSLSHFKADKMPRGAAARCLDCPVEQQCAYSAKKLYLDSVAQGHTGWPVSVITEVPDIESVTHALRHGPYGRCVYQSDNDVIDHQVVSMEFEGGATSAVTVVAFTEAVCSRETRIHGTKGELSANISSDEVHHFDFVTAKKTVHSVREERQRGLQSSTAGHGGADFFALDAFISAVLSGNEALVSTGPDESLRSHYLCFAAEKARLEKRVVDTLSDLSV